MPGESYNTQNHEPNQTTEWDNLKKEVPFSGDQHNMQDKDPTVDLNAEIRDTLETMDKHTSSYIQQFGSNIYNIFKADSENPESQEFAQSFANAFKQALAGDKLKGAYLYGNDMLKIGADADKVREWHMEIKGHGEDQVYTPIGSTDFSERAPTGDPYADNFHTMDERTQSYLGMTTTNTLFKLFDDDFAISSNDHIRQAISSGMLKGAYLDNTGALHTGESANEYRKRDKQESN